VTPTDPELIARALGGDDRAAFGALVQRHQSAVRRFLRHLARGDAALADDLAQDTFVHAYRKLGEFRQEAAFATWLLGIAHNHWRNARRKQRSVPLESGHLETLEPQPAAAAASDLRHDLAQAVRQLSTDEQTAVHLTYQQGLSHSEVAAVVGWPLGTVKTHLARGKDKLRILLAPWNPQT
jgi:RNA polymerase sigma factor (sigma-70 family)